MGDGCKGRDVGKQMAQAISDVYFQETKSLIIESKSPVALMMDGDDSVQTDICFPEYSYPSVCTILDLCKLLFTDHNIRFVQFFFWNTLVVQIEG